MKRTSLHYMAYGGLCMVMAACPSIDRDKSTDPEPADTGDKPASTETGADPETPPAPKPQTSVP